MRTKFFKAWGQKEIHQEGYRKFSINIKLHDIQSHYFEDYLKKRLCAGHTMLYIGDIS